MLKTEGVYDEFCYSEVSIATTLNHTFLSSQLNGHPNDRNASLLSAKLNATLSSLPDYIATELPSFNTTNADYNETTEEDDLKNPGSREADEENATTTERPGDAEVDANREEERTEEEKVSENANPAEDEATESGGRIGGDNGENDDPSDPSESVTSVNSESIHRIKNVPSIPATLPTPAPVRAKRDNHRSDNDAGKNGPISQVTFSFLFD